MIKFWKSAAKGKTGCPVRPPETSAIDNSGSKTYLDTHIDGELQENSRIFLKKSKLNLSVHDILVDKKAIKYFIQFMETIGQHVLVKCWLELDNFKVLVLKNSLNGEIDNHWKLSRTKSFDLQCNSHSEPPPTHASQRFSWTEDSANACKQNMQECSTSSLGNLAEHSTLVNVSDYKSKHYNPTEEAINLFKKYVALEAPHQLDLPDSLRKIVITNICHPEGQIKEDCFKPVEDELFNQIEQRYFKDFQNSPLYIKAQIDILTSGSLGLEDILYNEAILFYFMEYMEQESCSILLEFLMAVMHFRDNLLNANTTSPEQAQTDAIVLYDKYFSLQATSPVGFPTNIRSTIESDICREGGPLPTCFDIPYQIVFNTLNRYVKAFLESELYYKYLSEMIHSVDNMWSANHKSHSDCSSEFSLSTQNTLLAMGDPIFRKKKRNHSVPDMTIDSNQLYNADSLWQRKRYDGLILGRVNSLGRFESKFEPDPDKKDKSVLKKMVSRFVPINTSKVDEEMAWQIAHMIVKDVTDLTMAPPENERDDV
ncbi:A-kinase anchor protein 10, mitochondrial [Cydia pomonella]|uniref:A-kinase anchor protein 10, mitochondrial n=1 Tax=Cydia pomonella TaxID=82600 RepID=UPI002ADDF123|nr:A-kinase anchor protein 10, mitochondrial [Cydia pomonella]